MHKDQAQVLLNLIGFLSNQLIGKEGEAAIAEICKGTIISPESVINVIHSAASLTLFPDPKLRQFDQLVIRSANLTADSDDDKIKIANSYIREIAMRLGIDLVEKPESKE